MRKFFFPILSILLLISAISVMLVSADDGDDPYYQVETITLRDGKTVDQTTINGPSEPPPGYELERTSVALPEPNIAKGTNTLPVPAFDWFFGCSATSGAMISGYYDRNDFPNMYTGPTNGGVVPLDSSGWPDWMDGNGDTYEQCPLTASHNGLDGRSTRGSIDDYWVEYDSSTSDPYITNGWTQHTWGDAIGDYMKTSQSAYSNTDGSTTFYTWTSSSAQLTCSDMVTEGISSNDGTYGRKLFYEARGYTVTDCYNQKTDNNGGGFTYAMYKAEIDAGRPVMINLYGHTVVGVGYNDPSTVYIHDTWDYNVHSFTWGGSYQGMVLMSVSIVNLAEPAYGYLEGTVSDDDTSAPIVGATVSANGSFETTTGTGGTYELTLPEGTYDLTVSASGYKDSTISSVSISEGVTTTQDVSLTALGDLSYDPETLEVTLYWGDSTTVPFTLTLSSGTPTTYEFLEEESASQSGQMVDNPRSMVQSVGVISPDARQVPADIGFSAPKIFVQSTSSTLLSEGFEAGVVPPSGWTEDVTNTGYNWKLNTTDAYSGLYAAEVLYDDAPAYQDEWLLSPEMTLVNGSLSFWSGGSTYWCRDTYDNCDLDIWLVVGDVGGGDDIYIGTADDDWTASWTWSQSTFNLTPYLPGGVVRIGFNYVGYDGAQILLDAITLEGESDIAWLSEDPITGTITTSAPVVIDITFDASAVGKGGIYTSTLHILSEDTLNPDQSVPVVMNVIYPYAVYLPTILK